MSTTYVESDCTIAHGGRTYESGGAVVSDEWIIAYLGADGSLTDWHGREIGRYRITSSWRTPRSYVSSHMHQVRAVVNGATYTGRTSGLGMILKARRVRTGGAR